jgi:hypothetical protein
MQYTNNQCRPNVGHVDRIPRIRVTLIAFTIVDAGV